MLHLVVGSWEEAAGHVAGVGAHGLLPRRHVVVQGERVHCHLKGRQGCQGKRKNNVPNNNNFRVFFSRYFFCQKLLHF